MNEETVDVGEWLHQSFHKAYPFAMRRINECNGRYKVTEQFLFDALYEREILTPSHLSSAEFLVTLHEVATSKTGYAKMLSIVQSIKGGDKIPGFCPTTLMKLIINHMTSRQWAMSERICIKDVRSVDFGWIEQCRNSIRDSFDALGKSIEISIDILKERLQNAHNYEGRTMPKILHPLN